MEIFIEFHLQVIRMCSTTKKQKKKWAKHISNGTKIFLLLSDNIGVEVFEIVR